MPLTLLKEALYEAFSCDSAPNPAVERMETVKTRFLPLNAIALCGKELGGLFHGKGNRKS